MQQKNKLLIILTIAVCAAVFATRWSALSSQAVCFDDTQYLIDNPLVRNPSFESARRFLTEIFDPSTVKGYYQPLTMISLMLDCAFGGRVDNLMPFHLTSLLLHTVNTALIIFLLYELFGHVWIAAAVGLLFGVHPLTVESIPWISERKTLLAAFFALWSLVFYVHFAQKNNRKAYIGCLLMYLLALLSKPTSTPLPVVMLLMDFWPLKRLKLQAVLEKLPLFFIGGLSAVITYISQSRAGSVVTSEPYGAAQVPLAICHNIIFYLYKMVWPANLSSHYAFPEPFGLSQPSVIIGVAGTIVLISLLLLSLRLTRAALTGWLIFFVMVFPTMQVYRFSDVIAADKFICLPSIGILMILASFLIWVCGPFDAGRHTAKYIILTIIILMLAGAESFASWQYLKEWKDTIRLFRHMVKVTPNALPPRTCLGLALEKQGDFEQAMECFKDNLRIDPNNFNAYVNMGVIFASQGKLDEAAKCYKEAIRLSPKNAGIYRNLAIVLVAGGHIDEAFAAYHQGLEQKPNHTEYLYDGLALLLSQQDRIDEAISYYNEAIRVSPETAGIYRNFGRMLAERGKVNEAVAVFRNGLQRKPDHPEYLHAGLGQLLLQEGKTDEGIAELRAAVKLQPDAAIFNSLGTAMLLKGNSLEAKKYYEASIRLDPNNSEVHYNLGNILLSQTKLKEAISEYERAIAVNHNYANAYVNLAVALMQSGRIDESIVQSQTALKIDPNHTGAHYNLAIAMTNKGLFEQAISEYRQVLQIDPMNAEAHSMIGDILAHLGRPQEAIIEYRNALEINPQDMRAHEGLKSLQPKQ